MANELPEAPALELALEPVAELAPEPAELELAGGLELDPELEHPAIPSRPAAATAAPIDVAVRKLRMSMTDVYSVKAACSVPGLNK